MGRRLRGDAPYAGPDRPDTAARLWHGVLEGTRWAALDTLPLPTTGMLRPLHSSPLLRYGDTLAWAHEMDRPDGQRDMVVYERRGGKWSHEVARTVFGSYPRLAHSPSAGLVLAVVQPRPEPPGLMRDGNSLIFWTRRPDWRALRKVVPSTLEQVHAPWLSLAPEGGVLGWQAWIENPADGSVRREAHAMFGRLDERNEPIVVLDSAVSSSSFLAPVALGRSRVWVLDHHPAPGEPSEIRFVRDSAGAVSVLGRIPNPYTTRFVAAPASPSDVVIAGGFYDTPNRTLVTLLIRARLECG